MYRFNRFQRPVLIIADEVVAKMASEGFDLRILENSIEVAEEKYIRPLFGYRMYEDFIEQKNVTITTENRAAMLTKINTSLTTSGITNIVEADLPVGSVINSIEEVLDENYKELWFRYLWRICAEAVDAAHTIPTWLRTTNQGQQKHNPAGFASDGKISTGSRDDIAFKLDRMVQGRIGSLVDGMKEWMSHRKAGFPYYDFPDCGILQKGRKAGFVLGIYRDDIKKKSTTPNFIKPLSFQFLTVDGQLKFPYSGMARENYYREAIKNSVFDEFTREGFFLYRGTAPDEIQFNTRDGEISFNVAQDAGLRCTLKIYK